jgi:hypothetical protein
VVHPEVVNGGDSLHICRLAADLLSKLSQAANKGETANFRVGWGHDPLTIITNVL